MIRMAQTAPVVDLDTDTTHARGWSVIIHDDDVTPMDLVTMAVQKAAGLSLEVAEMVMLETHHKGCAVVKSGLDRLAAERMAAKLSEYTRIPRICPGIRTELRHETA